MNNPKIWETKPIVVIDINITKALSVPISSLQNLPVATLDKLLKAKYNKGYLSKDVEDILLLESIHITIYFILLILLIIQPIVSAKTINNSII